MKKTLYIILFTVALNLVSTASKAGNITEETNNIVYVNAPRFVRPLIDKWISEYKKVQPSVNIALAKNATEKKSSALNIQLSANGKSGIQDNTVYFGKYAVLLVTAKNSEAAKVFAGKELNKKKLKNLLFVNDEYEEPVKEDKLIDKVVVYSGNSTSSVSLPYASHFGKETSNYRGKRIAGDDVFLNAAILKDTKGIAVNTLSNIYDFQSRQLKDDLELVPLDVDKSQREATASLDALLNVLESDKSENIPVEKIGFTFTDNNGVITDFISWVLANGEEYNHQYGLLRLSSFDVAQENSKVNKELLTAQK